MLSLAAILLAPIFTDHAVLQQGKSVPVWGQAGPGERVAVAFGGQVVSALADSQGAWIAYLDAMKANSVPRDLTVGPVVIHDLVVGEVWLASGQSNMEFEVNNATHPTFRVEHATEEVAAANYPLIRHFKVAHQAAAEPQRIAKGQWAICSPSTVGNFSAIAYFYARDLYRRLQVPIGIINATWGGSPIEAWMSPLAFQLSPQRRPHPGPLPHRDYWNPTWLYNGMISPVVPYAIRGAIWYQGEANGDVASEYATEFSALITSWRQHFRQGDFPFYWVQLANFTLPMDRTGMQFAELRAAQTATLALPATGQAIAIDGNDPANLHPRNKQEIARRLALIARNQVYGIPGDFSGPKFERAVREHDAIRVDFSYADNGLIAMVKPAQSFELAGADGRFYPASVTVSGASAFVRTASVPHPVMVRYAWRNAPEANLYNGWGLPAVPFSAPISN